MKKTTLLFLLCTIIALPFCKTSKTATGKNMKEPTVNYMADVAPILGMHCTPCHFPPTGQKLPLNTFEAVRTNVDAILYRTQLPHDDPKFMPFKMKKEPLSDSLINVIKRWKEQGFGNKASE